MKRQRVPHRASPSIRLARGGLALVSVVGLTALLLWGTGRMSHYQSEVTEAPSTQQAESLEVEKVVPPRVLVFFDPSRTDCVQCELHVWRFAYYTFQFQRAGAEVIGVAAGLRSGVAQLDSKLALPWETLYDLSAQLQRFYGVKWDANPNPVVSVVDSHGDVLYRGQPQDVDDRLEGNVLTTVLAAQRGADSTVAQQVD